MASLKDAAKARAKSRRAKPEEDDGHSVEELAVPPEEFKPTPNVASGQAYHQPPPLPPALVYMRMVAQIPALRKKQ